MREIYSLPWKSVTKSANSRRVQHYGFEYNYMSHGAGSRKVAPPFPPAVAALVPLLPKPFPGQPWNQCIVNEYTVGQGIAWHTDKKYFGEGVACFTLGEAGKMRFRDPPGAPMSQKFSGSFDGVCLRPKSGDLYLMIGPARHFAEHSMSPLQKRVPAREFLAPPYTAHPDGRRRVSVTFRYSP